MLKRPVQWLFSSDGSLRDRALRGGGWLFLGSGVAQATGLLKLIVLSRLLTPHDFGLMAVAFITLKWFGHFSQTGFTAALIQTSGEIRQYLDTAWTVQLIRGTSLAVVLCLGAPFWAWCFGNPEATPIIRAIGLGPFVGGFVNPATVYLRKELEFQQDVLWQLIGNGAGLITAIPLAIIYQNVWALVLSVIAAQLASTLASYWIKPYWPRLKLEWPQVRELIHFGKWVFWSRVLVSLTFSLDSLIIGKMMGAAALGFYRMAHHLAMLPTEQIGVITYTVMFPAFSKLQNAGDRQRAFLQTLTYMSLVAIPSGCFLTVLAEPLIWVVLGEQWTPIAPTSRVLVWAGVATAITRTSNAFLLAVGKPSLFTRTSLVRLIILAGLLYPMVVTLGTTGAGLAVTISALVAMFYQLALVAQQTGLGLTVVGAFKSSVLASAPFLGMGLVFPPSPLLLLVAGLAIGAYFAILLTMLWYGHTSNTLSARFGRLR